MQERATFNHSCSDFVTATSAQRISFDSPPNLEQHDNASANSGPVPEVKKADCRVELMLPNSLLGLTGVEL
jgi:hypothetical protein